MHRVRRFSTQQIMRISRAYFSRFPSEKVTDLSTIQHFFGAAEFGLSCEEIKDIELVLLLLASADKVGNKQFDEARKLLNLCHFLSSDKGNPVQRAVHYFGYALQERIADRTETVSSTTKKRKLLLPAEKRVNPAIISCNLKLPCVQLVQFSGIQVVMDSLVSAKKVHFLDFGIVSGGHCTVLMQALASRQEFPIELLKITGVGVITSGQIIEDAGKSLACFAKTLDLPFSFKTAIVANIKDLTEDMFELSDDEAVAIYLPGVLRHIKAQQGCLQCLLRVLRKLHPCVMVIVELELNHNSPLFVDRFAETLLFYSSCFDSVEDCINRYDPNRISIEARMGDDIVDIIAAKDEEKILEHMKIDEWRNYFTRFGLVETEISVLSFDQAELLLRNFASGKSCLLVKNGKCLVTGWKGTPLLSLSAWKFQQGKSKRNSTKKSIVCQLSSQAQ